MTLLKRSPRSILPKLFLLLIAVFLTLNCTSRATAQKTGELHGQVLDPTGALVPGATVTLSSGSNVTSTKSEADGVYTFRAVAPGSYNLSVTAEGFAPFSKSEVEVTAGRTRQLNLSLKIATQEQDVNVTGQTNGVSVNPDENSSAIVIKGSDLDALSDDPDELQNELQALAGPAAGPSGGQIYIDGFTGGQLPPKSSIREIRVNQNPFSAEFDKIGYGRIEILTKPGSDKFSGHATSLGSDSALNTQNPLIHQQPSYYLYLLQGDVNGPLTKHASYFFNAFRIQRETQNIVDTLDPQNPSAAFNAAVANPSSFFTANPRFDFQLGKNNTLSIRDSYSRSEQTGSGISSLSLPEQAYDVHNQENAIQLSDTIVVNSHIINETRFQWRRIRSNQVSTYLTPTITVSGVFTTGGNNSGVVRDHQDVFELQNYSTATAGKHTIRFGTRLRAYRDANFSTSGANGYYTFQSLNEYLNKTPNQYQATVITNPLARALLFDGALFYQDDWRWKPNFTLSYGLRYEGQNRIRDHADWGPRIALAWAPGHPGKKPAKTVLRAGYGWFYDRFTVPNSFSAATGTPYIIQAIHQNGTNQRNYVVKNPGFYDPTTPVSPGVLESLSSSLPTNYSIDHHFHAALSMQGGVGIDQQIGKIGTFNVTYLYTRGVHQYLSNNVTAPDFDPATYTVIGALPDVYDYQFQSGGIFNQHQIIVTANTRLRKLSLHTSYTFNEAKSDTQGVTYFPSVSKDPGLDYGRASFGIHQRLFMLGTYSAPHRIIFAPLLAAQSGTPYNFSIGGDLTGNNQFNARPTYGVCGAADVVSTPYGCLDTNPVGKGEKMIPYGLGTGPANVVFHMRVSKVIGIGPVIEGTKGGPGGPQGGGSVSGRGLSGNNSRPQLDATVSRRYSLTFVVGALNLFNIVNLGPPNGVLNSRLFGKTQSLASGPFGSPTPGNRTVFLQAMFNF